MKATYTKWALSARIKGKRYLLRSSDLGWYFGNEAKGVILFHTRENARHRQQYDNNIKTRVEKVCVTVETIS